MSESHENLLKQVRHCQESLDKYTESRNDGKLLHYLQRLYKLPIKVVHLEQTGVGRTVNGLRKLGGEVGDTAKGLVAKWKEMVVGEQEEEEDDEDDDDDEDEDDEDGYQTGDEQESEKEEPEERRDTSSSHRKSDKYRTDKEKLKHSSKSEKHYSESTKSSKREKEKYKQNGDKHKSHKRKEESDSEEETYKKRHKKSEDEDRHKHKRKHSSDEEEPKVKEKKHKSSEKKHKHSSDTEHKPKHKESSSKDKERQKSSKKDDYKKHEHSSKTKDNEKKSKDKEKVRDEKKPKKDKSVNGNLLNGIDSGSGASFAEALGMCEPSSSTKTPSKKKEKPEKKEKTNKTDDLVPKLLKEPTVEPPADLNLSSLLPPITPNYRPLGNLLNCETQPKKVMSEYETLASIITSKNQRTKVYSGNKIGYGKVPSLFELCVRILQDNIDALEYTGGVPYNILKPILEKATPNQLYLMEHHNPYLIEDTDELWQQHCNREFKNKRREELESWREMYLRCLDERDAKLKALTANIKQSQDKSLPVRMTKLAYVDAVAKPPRNIARKQAKNGTAFDVRKPSVTPSAKLSTIATSGEAGKVSVPNPGSRAVERSSSHATKPKKAPLMLKSISSFKNRFKR